MSKCAQFAHNVNTALFKVKEIKKKSSTICLV
jgi:hypothetical protein